MLRGPAGFELPCQESSQSRLLPQLAVTGARSALSRRPTRRAPRPICHAPPLCPSSKLTVDVARPSARAIARSPSPSHKPLEDMHPLGSAEGTRRPLAGALWDPAGPLDPGVFRPGALPSAVAMSLNRSPCFQRAHISTFSAADNRGRCVLYVTCNPGKDLPQTMCCDHRLRRPVVWQFQY
jgi:hypothetical protein